MFKGNWEFGGRMIAYDKKETPIYVSAYLLVFADFIICITSCLLALSLTPFSIVVISYEHVFLTFLYTTVFLGLSHAADLHNQRKIILRASLLKALAIVLAITICVVLVVLSFILYIQIGRTVYVLIFIFNLVLAFLVRESVRYFFFNKQRYKVAFVGSREFIRDAQEYVSNTVPGLIECVPARVVLSNIATKSKVDVDEVVIESSDSIASRERLDAMSFLFSGVRLSYFTNFVEKLSLKVPIQYIETNWFLAIQNDRIGSGYGKIIKRALDILFGVVGLTLSSPIIVLFALVVKIDSPGPSIYKQQRVGLAGKLFDIYKIRTMGENSEVNGAVWAAKNDYRVTRVGRLLRKSRIDELPQFWNILKGDMSFIGPRPERPEFVKTLSDNLEYYDCRHLVKPGLTGWAQINLPYGASVDDAEKKLELDLYYVKNCSFELDTHILLRTIVSIGHGAR